MQQSPYFSFVYSEKPRPYTGLELRPHFLLTELGLQGSGIGAFIGPCDVKTEHLVDWEDRLAQDSIRAKSMIHFIGEFFGISIREGVLRQRLLMALAGETLNARLLASGKHELLITRTGDDLFALNRKISVSIVTASPVSQLLHVGINIDPDGAPVPAIGLTELGVDPSAWISEVLAAFSEEIRGMEWACTKVRPVV